MTFEEIPVMKIRFSYEGKNYRVNMAAYEGGLLIRLPDGRVLGPDCWLESIPPQPSGLKVVETYRHDQVIDAVDDL